METFSERTKRIGDWETSTSKWVEKERLIKESAEYVGTVPSVARVTITCGIVLVENERSGDSIEFEPPQAIALRDFLIGLFPLDIPGTHDHAET